MTNRFTIVVVLSLLLIAATESSALACYAIVVGRGASADGAVLVAHAEQNAGRQLLNFRRIPRQQHARGSTVPLGCGGEVPQVAETWGFLWSEIPGQEFSDGFLNEWGVAVVSDYCPSREDNNTMLAARGEIRHGGIGYMLRRLVAERARTAREGVELAGKLVEQFGYVDSGRTYVIADPHEAWLVAVVRGRHWVARRVPDDAVVLLPNVYVIDEVDLQDTKNFLGSRDLQDYAVRRGWFKPAGGKFRFDRVYGGDDGSPDVRRWKGMQLVLGRYPAAVPREMPFSVTPPRKMTVAAAIEVLRGVIPADRTAGSPTQEGAVFQLRSELPREIGCVYWRTSGEPSMNVLLPWYLGIEGTPANYYRPGELREQLSLEHHLQRPPVTGDEPSAWWLYQRLEQSVRNDVKARLPAVRKAWDALEREALAQQPAVEKRALDLWRTDPGAARAYLSEHCSRLAKQADREAARMLKSW